MAESSKPSLTLFQRLLLYGTPTVSAVACGLMVFWVSQLQSRIGQQEAICDTLLANQRRFAGEDDSDIKASSRHARALDTSPPRVGSLEYHLEKMADLQLQSLRASCLRNEKICIQGPKGDTGSKGLKGDQGINGDKGGQGLRGSKGEKGEPGNWTSGLVAPTFIVIPSKTVEASVGEKAVLKCYADGYPRPKITWSRTARSFKESSITSNSTWVIERVEMQDFGQYHCTATNSLGSTTHSFRVSPTGGTAKVSTNIVTGRNASLRCSLCSEDGYSLKWKKPEDELQSDRVQIDGCLLTITNITLEDSGNYTCIAIREYDGEILRETISLTIRGPNDRTYPGAVSKPCPGVAVEYNKDAVLKCTLCGFKLPGFSFTWERASGEIAKNRAFTKDCTLVISKVTLQDAGNYTCVARFKSSAVLGETIPLCVKASAQVTSRFTEVVTVREGQSTELQCDGVGPPVPEVYWTKGSVRLPDNGTGILRIDNATQKDKGDYYCHAVNYLGRQVKGTKLVVTKLEFRIRPPATVDAYVSQKVVIDCTASVAPGFPLVCMHWVMSPSCGQSSAQYDVIPNGTLVISQPTLHNTGLYICKAYTLEETVTAAVYLHLSSANPRDQWMLTADSCGGLRQSTYNSSVYYAVSAYNLWDKSKYYQCPRGYHWACTEEGRRIFKNNNNWSGTYVYRSQCGWSNYVFGGLTRYYFRFRDSAITNAYKNSGNYDEYRIEISGSTTEFAGIVCIKD